MKTNIKTFVDFINESQETSVKDLLFELTKNLWKQSEKGTINYGDVAKDVKVDGRTNPGLFLYRKKLSTPMPGASEEQKYCEVYLTKDLQNVKFSMSGDIQSFNLTNSYGDIVKLITSKKFTQYK